MWEKVEKKISLVKLSKQENIRRQIANMISLSMVPQDDCMKQIIVELCNVNSKSDKLTDYILNNYVEDAGFLFHIWNHFDSIGERPRTNNHLEGYHRQLNARIQRNLNL